MNEIQFLHECSFQMSPGVTTATQTAHQQAQEGEEMAAHCSPWPPLPREVVGFQAVFQVQSFGADIHRQEPNGNKSNPNL